MTLENFLFMMIGPIGALVIAAILIITTDREPDDRHHTGPAE